MANMHKKKCSTSLIIRKIQIKIVTRYCLILIRMDIIKKTENNTVVEMWRNCNPHTLLVEMWSETATLENSVVIFQKVKHKMIIFSIPIRSIYPREMKRHIHRLLYKYS